MPTKKIILFIEFLILFFGIPVALLLSKDFMLPSTILFPVLIFILFVLHKNPEFKWKELLKWEIDKKTLLQAMAIIVLMTIFLFIYILVLIPDQLFNLPKNNWKIWLIISFFYPVFSVFAQEIIYRTFIFRRYIPVFNKPIYFVLASSISFSFAHIFYYSTFSILSTLILGLFLSSYYLKTKSVLFTSLIHGILGDIIFAIGLGQYFWLDMVNHYNSF